MDASCKSGRLSWVGDSSFGSTVPRLALTTERPQSIQRMGQHQR